MERARYFRSPDLVTSGSVAFQQSEKKEIQGAYAEFTDPEEIQALLGVYTPNDQELRQIQTFYMDMIKTLKVSHACVRCGLDFSMWTHAGLRGCRAHHGGFYKGVWHCCMRTNSHAHVDPTQGITYEPKDSILGCINADHLLTGEERSVTPHQLDKVHAILTRHQPEESRHRQIDEVLVPPRRTLGASVDVPFLVLILMPDLAQRNIARIRCDNIHRGSVPVAAGGPHPFNQPLLIGISPEYRVDLADVTVSISRMN